MIKKVQIVPGDPMLNVCLQIDVIDPLDRKKRQTIPLKSVNYCDHLDFRIRFDPSQVEA